MIKLNTVFDYAHEVPEPQYSVLYDTGSKDIKFIPLYFKDSKNTIRGIKNNLSIVFDAIKNNKIIINDVLSHAMSLKKFGFELSNSYDIHECRQQKLIDFKLENEIKKNLVKGLINMPDRISDWMSIKAKSSLIYAELTDRGVQWGPHFEKPIYDTNTLTGRSRTRGFNIQGSTDQDPICHVDGDKIFFICFDWVSADMRVAGFLSGDKFINRSFEVSDPYTELEKILCDNSITRDDCKLEMLKSIYSVNLDGPLLDLVPELKEWMSIKKEEYLNGNVLKTILGMEIPRQNLKSSFNGIIQGSIAEAIQNVLIKISQTIGSRCILTEIHDSLIVCCSQKEIQKLISKIIPIVIEPFDTIDLKFPVKVSIGKKWKQWKKFKVFK